MIKSETIDRQSSNYTPLTMSIKPGNTATSQLSLVLTMHNYDRGSFSLCFLKGTGTGPDTAATAISKLPYFLPAHLLFKHLPQLLEGEGGVKRKMPASGPNSGTDHPSEAKDSSCTQDFHRPLHKKLQYQAPPLITIHVACLL